MAWTVPITFVDNTVLTASQLNTYLRDNFMETMPGRASTVGAYFVTAGRNRIAQRAMKVGYISSVQSIVADQTEYTDTPTVGPMVTVETDSRALVFLDGHMKNNDASVRAAWMSYEVSGATSSDAQDNRALMFQTTLGYRGGCTILHDNLTPGLNTFTAKYRVSTAGTGTFAQRRLGVMPI